MKYAPLADMTILDFSHRLPGPLSTLQLSRLGARVIKVEDKSFGDPFDGGSFDEMDASFSDWYQTLNEGKEIQKVDLQKDIEKIRKLVSQSSIILMGLPKKVQEKCGLTFEDCSKIKPSGVFLEMTSSRQRAFGMHDLNALAQNNLLELHLNGVNERPEWLAPPFLPVAGIAFASHLATEALAALVLSLNSKKWIKRTAALEEAVQSLLVPLYSENLRKSQQREFLHNGRYPCYAIYPLRDRGYLAVASVEAKYWDRFNTSFSINIDADKRFQSDKDVFKMVAKKVHEITYDQAKAICKDLDACVTLIL